jgi:hypothetical protein
LIGPRSNFNIEMHFIPMLINIVPVALLSILIIDSSRKIKDIKNPRQSTYCILSVYIIEALRISLIINMLQALVRMMFFYMGDNYFIFINAEGGFRIFYSLLSALAQLTSLLVVNLQIIEWWALVYIISSQSGRKLEEILYDHESEHMNQSWI